MVTLAYACKVLTMSIEDVLYGLPVLENDFRNKEAPPARPRIHSFLPISSTTFFTFSCRVKLIIFIFRCFIIYHISASSFTIKKTSNWRSFCVTPYHESAIDRTSIIKTGNKKWRKTENRKWEERTRKRMGYSHIATFKYINIFNLGSVNVLQGAAAVLLRNFKPWFDRFWQMYCGNNLLLTGVGRNLCVAISLSVQVNRSCKKECM